MRVSGQTLFISVVVFLKAELGLSPVIQCNLLCNLVRNFVEGAVTSALREVLRRVAHRTTDNFLAEQFTSAVSESQNLVPLFGAVKAFCFAGICPFYGRLHDVLLHKTCHAVFKKIARQVA